MNVPKKVSISVVSAVLVFIMVSAVMASSWTTYSPLYTLRMEQASAKMNFLPTEKDIFTYATEKGFDLNYSATGECCGAVTPLETGVWTCYYSTCGGETCVLTCPASCYGTCNDPTCPVTCSTCDTCAVTCPLTCWKTCFCHVP